MDSWKRSIAIVSILFILSISGSFVLFYFLDSGGQGKYEQFSIEGALVGFVVVFSLLGSYYLRIQKTKIERYDLEVHIVFQNSKKPSMAEALAFYQKLPNEKLEPTKILNPFGDYQVQVPRVAMQDTVRVWLKTGKRWWASDTVTSSVRHLAFKLSKPPMDAAKYT